MQNMENDCGTLEPDKPKLKPAAEAGLSLLGRNTRETYKVKAYLAHNLYIPLQISIVAFIKKKKFFFNNLNFENKLKIHKTK